MFHADERTEEQTAIKKLIVAFRKFALAPKNIATANCFQKVGEFS